MANKKARILVEHQINEAKYKPNQVIDADAALIKSLVKQGIADDSADAVKYCIEQEGAKPILHQSPAEAACQANIAALQSELDQLHAELAAVADAAGDTAPIVAQIVAQIEAKQAELAAL